MSKQGYFFCYNKSVSDHLQKEGVEYITVSRDLKTNKIFSLYINDEKLTQALNTYKKHIKTTK